MPRKYTPSYLRTTNVVTGKPNIKRSTDLPWVVQTHKQVMAWMKTMILIFYNANKLYGGRILSLIKIVLIFLTNEIKIQDVLPFSIFKLFYRLKLSPSSRIDVICGSKLMFRLETDFQSKYQCDFSAKNWCFEQKIDVRRKNSLPNFSEI